MPLDPKLVANVEQAEAWDGAEGAHWANHSERYDEGMREHRALLREVARIAPHEAVLDIGCGNGESTQDAARAASAGTVVGLDLSSAMLERARTDSEAEGLTNVEFVQGDAQVFAFEPESFDIAISKFGVMFFADPVAAFANIARALRRDGRLALVVWRSLADNEWVSTIRNALALGRELPSPPPNAPGPFGLSDVAYASGILRDAGFTDIGFEPRDAPYYAGANADDAFTYTSTLGFTRLVLNTLDDNERAVALDALRAAMVEHDHGDGVRFGSAVWLITAVPGRR